MEETKSCGSDTCPIAKKETPKEALCTALYQTAKMGSGAILALLEKLGQTESPLRAELTALFHPFRQKRFQACGNDYDGLPHGHH